MNAIWIVMPILIVLMFLLGIDLDRTFYGCEEATEGCSARNVRAACPTSDYSIRCGMGTESPACLFYGSCAGGMLSCRLRCSSCWLWHAARLCRAWVVLGVR